MLKTAILGCGGIAQKHAAAALNLKDDIELTAFCDLNGDKAREFADRYTSGKAQVYTDHHEMFERAGLDLALICLPPFAHSDEVEVAARHGVHLLVEKPIALQSSDAWQMVHCAEAAGIQTQVGFMYRHGAAVQRLRAMLASGDCGPLGLMRARYDCNALHAPWWRALDKSGGQLVEQIIHLFDLNRYLMGEPKAVFSRQENLFHRDVPGYTIEDVSATLITFQSGALGVVYATNAAIPGRWIKEWGVVGRGIAADFTDWNRAVFTHTADPDLRQETIASEDDVFTLQLADLVRSIRTGRATCAPLREGARSLDLVLAARRSSLEGREISL